MFASRHVVFIGPGALDASTIDELGSAGSQLDGGDRQGPRLAFACASASDAERLTSLLQERQRPSLVAGPEQPPPEANWRTLVALAQEAESWHGTDGAGERFRLELPAARAVSIVDWKDGHTTVDRAALLYFEATDRPLYVRASTLGGEGTRQLADLLDAVAGCLPPEGRVRRREAGPGPLRTAGLVGDVLPLMLHVVDALDTQPGTLSRPLAPARRTSDEFPSPQGTRRPLGAVLAWTWWGLSLLSMPVVLLLLGAVAWLTTLQGAASAGLAVALGAWASQRLYWARWVERTTFGSRSVIPAWPLAADEPGRPPAPPGVALEVVLLAFSFLLRTGAHPTSDVATVLAMASPALLALAVLGLWERAVAAHWIEK